MRLLDRERVGRTRVIGLGSRGRTRCRRDRETARQRFLRCVGGPHLLRVRSGRIRLNGQPLRQMLRRRLRRVPVVRPACVLRARPVHVTRVGLIRVPLTQLRRALRALLRRSGRVGRHGDTQGRAVER
ncbi:hypothetical protein C5B73_09705 [Nocardia cyriacigeorgica]|nr:hypothetical protein C5B73_09705 [Nocardia cyriacigeorgica]